MPPDRPRFAKKRFGQHFLERPWVDKILRAIEPQASETFIEIGPGRGALTRPLAAAVERVVAFEIDRDLASELRENAPPNLAIVEGDFLDLTADRVRNALAHEGGAPARVRVAGNLPYNVASPMLFKLIALYRDGIPLLDATVMLQREVADRLAASPGTREYGVLSVLVRHGADVKRLLSLPPGAFRPAPNVHSALVRLQFHPDEPPARDEARFREAHPGHLHETPQDPRKCPARLSALQRRSSGRGPATGWVGRPAATRNTRDCRTGAAGRCVLLTRHRALRRPRMEPFERL